MGRSLYRIRNEATPMTTRQSHIDQCDTQAQMTGEMGRRIVEWQHLPPNSDLARRSSWL
jgi:hypothetical protein